MHICFITTLNFQYFTVEPSEAYPQDYINELSIWILNPLIVSRVQQWSDYLNMEPPIGNPGSLCVSRHITWVNIENIWGEAL